MTGCSDTSNGAGQLAAGRVTAGLFFASWILFLAVGSQAVLETMDRLVATLPLLGGSTETALAALVAAFAGIAVLHVAAAIDAPVRWDAIRAHPLVSAAVGYLEDAALGAHIHTSSHAVNACPLNEALCNMIAWDGIIFGCSFPCSWSPSWRSPSGPATTHRV